ncbi:TetR/AcrR family transcriptional regulator [Paenibacillus apiarius]|uniref:TetR/AcrR family transcriptional regulator n=1 Tax=Paenibacillus apiarius TaxID=46240 RepID=A0ABT4DTM6_9BACL|nr:TetR/AcrR family transcriptional regulator [Paenibacillus apiarius]MCY9513395.1 TetR/AcrR family transcriptional regulator [Paenibacillus apiarius]MCY9519633.1 TetR/AcrR family transcriptional regulator [Paenibacillus apiarius]MCY9553311.1 TetR/AcrR family transcriptional regulator [Paenibacillus apiarius]MCY9557161.1 TetR/AcrR family transcriptional regulator [Paenibacillus apiarius]MCY9682098.1 TetR/AcrR family transcriptional regulator [Paenibacillus apiarius]
MKERLMQAALDLMTLHGLKFTMSDLASELGTSKRTIYEHFSSKEDLIGAIVDESIAEVIQIEKGIYENDSLTWLEKLKQVLSIVPSGLKLSDRRLLAEMKRVAPKEWNKINNFLLEEWGWGTVKNILEKGIAAGDIRPVNVPSVLQMMIGASAAIFDPDFLMRSSCTLQQAVETMAEMVTLGLSASQANSNDTR